jgi:5-(carboxyamino)imidazole ribonucleotide mutase
MAETKRARERGKKAATAPVVGILMGSDSDLPVMRAAYDVLAEFGIAAEVRVLSAHRNTDGALEYARSAADKGVRVIIAGAGGAAHLPVSPAPSPPLPVIGVPVPLAQLDGLDSLLSIVQMPSGIPVATVSIGGAKNAGLLAARILASGDEKLRAKVEDYQRKLKAEAQARDEKVRKQFS